MLPYNEYTGTVPSPSAGTLFWWPLASKRKRDLHMETHRLKVKPLGTLLYRHSLVIGMALMFLLTWPIDLANAGVLPFQVPFAVYILLG
jgi:hypothetical protein